MVDNPRHFVFLAALTEANNKKPPYSSGCKVGSFGTLHSLKSRSEIHNALRH